MQRRKFNPEFEVEAVRLVRERGVSAAQVARDLDVHENVFDLPPCWSKQWPALGLAAPTRS
jgi:transposase-like protein